LIYNAAVFLAGLLPMLLKTRVPAIGLRPLDRTLGAAFGVVRGLILLLAVAVVINMTALKTSTWWQESKGAEVLTAALKGLKPVLPEQFAKYLNQ
jgi:membrane protein required for colicin V production